VSDKPLQAAQAQRFDIGGRTLMPGLLDLHTHAYVSSIYNQGFDRAGEPYRTAHGVRLLGHALDCGFTTVRDPGGGDFSIANAIRDRLFKSPRFNIETDAAIRGLGLDLSLASRLPNAITREFFV
jgi:imidazolonepropionase-like amidohydrolase